ncbi:MAG: ABC transporter-related protein [Candidatus Gottesmanbacteria bacterium GW2011_GWC2_39_8]|uniref:ABC transporter-related protein n=1 Tax=Candidatus Gottesmanbacteria bacterium GW2011_GWC2_39_8 TaxID=1618450 RepID=A0A0G0Q675_9BACT|nr:MAG: ABC transporter-related protein [Candidatus Gottesmanbacteria bacterium GW2011_GWC2_39_8]
MKEIWKIITYTKSFKSFYILMGITVIALALLNQVSPLLTKQIVDLIVARIQGKPSPVELVLVLLAIILVSDIVITVLTDVSGYISDVMSARLNKHLSEKYFSHVLSLSIDYFDNEITGQIVNKLDRGIANITELINQSTNNFLPFFVSTAFTLIIIGYFSWPLAVLLFFLFPAYVYISHKSSIAWGKKEGAKNAIMDVTSGRVFEAISSIRVVKSFIQEAIELKFFNNERQKVVDLAKAQSREWHLYDFYRRLVLDLVMFSVFGYIVYSTFLGKFTIGEMTLLLQLANQARFPLFAMSFIIGQIQQAQAGSKDFFKVLDTAVSIKDKREAAILKRARGNIAFNNVSFSYSKGSEVLRNISFHVNPGNKLAIVGESGEGKSTIASLLLRFYETEQGSITIDGVNIQDLTQVSLRKNIGVVFQDTFLFSGSVYDNIRYSKDNATREDVERVAKIANAHEFIKKLPKGYDTEIGERGIKLSGGQKQRIAIARALLKDPPILIFDEATSSLDSKAEFEVQKALNKLMEGRTTIIIAHRLSTIRNVDQIVVIKGGKLVEQGTPDELEKINGIYAELLSYQALGTIPEKKLKQFFIEAG